MLRKPEMVLVIGPTGAGKTTYARAHYPYHYQPDREMCVRACTPDGALHYHPEMRVVGRVLQREAARILLARGFAVCLTEEVPTRKERAVWISWAREAGAAAHVVLLATPADVCVARAQADHTRPATSRTAWPPMVARWFHARAHWTRRPRAWPATRR